MNAVKDLEKENNAEYHSKVAEIYEKKNQSLQRLKSEEPKINQNAEDKVDDAKDDDYQNEKGKNIMSLDHEPVTDNHPQTDSVAEDKAKKQAEYDAFIRENKEFFIERLRYGSPKKEKQGDCILS
ncbi:uncharacterized protein LOC126836934 [Adelges cooleyi]|uniref:uncharacterized protein LOC126836934 n=1 Tax=Adelges cooleyi TaxID=133065 RepID=UPI00218030A8|nr:uncharacterized protein LOC126836934 [Adelges cooleyi]